MVFFVLARDIGNGHYCFDFHGVPPENFTDAWNTLQDIVDAVGGRIGYCGDGMPKFTCKTLFPVTNVTGFFNNGQHMELTKSVAVHWC
jgi:hypothetical protein